MHLPIHRIIRFIFYPFTGRIRLGEGGLLIFNASHAWSATHDAASAVFQSLLSLIVLCALYGFNDYVDREADLKNPKKNAQFSREILEQAPLFLAVNLLLSAAALLCCYLYLGFSHALALFGLFAVNISYSLKLKAQPVADILIVFAWGAFYILIAGKQHVHLAATVGVMTAIAHVFQMLTDKETDAKNKLNTSVLFFKNSEKSLVLLLFAVLGVFLFYQTNLLTAASVVLPVFLFLLTRNVTFSWYLSRFYFFAIWVVMLHRCYGIF